MMDLVRDNIKTLEAYSSARDEYELNTAIDRNIFLDANENPFNTVNDGLNRYPDPYQKSLKAKLSKLKGVPEKQMLLGNGSDEILDLIIRSFCEPKSDRMLICPPTYGMYEVLAQINAVIVDKVPLKADFSLNTDAILAAIKPKTKLIILCSPNNPTGNAIAIETIETILKQSQALIVLDEAYIDFSSQDSAVSLLESYPNLIVSQTLSKAWGMAGLRIGLAMASENIIAVLNKVKPPYNLNALSQQEAILRLEQSLTYQNQLKQVQAEKKLLTQKLQELADVRKVFPSDANFLLVKFSNARAYFKALKAKGIIVRDRSRVALCEDCLRISIGTPNENQILIETLKDLQL